MIKSVPYRSECSGTTISIKVTVECSELVECSECSDSQKISPLKNVFAINTIKGIGGPAWEKYIFFILTYVVGLYFFFPKWAHFSLNSNHCGSYARKYNDD